MEANFTFDEMVYNNIVTGKKIYHEDGLLYTIDYVKINKDTRQIKVHTVEGDVFMANQDEVFTWEVTNEKVSKKVNKRKNKRKNK